MRLLLLALLATTFGCGAEVSAGSDPSDAAILDDDAAAEPADASAAPADASLDAPDAAAAAPDASVAPDAGRADAGTPDAGGVADAGTPVPTTALLRPRNPMPCADPAVVSEAGANQVFYVYCTSMSHVWKTTDWVRFTDVRSSVTFDLTGMSANGKSLGAWWAPGLVYAPGAKQYVMWVSVPDAQATNGVDGWDTRALAALTATAPDGPWTFRGIAVDATVGEHFIDPFLFRDHDGGHYVYWKQYGGGVSSSIMGARVDSTWTKVVAGTSMEVMNGYGGTGTWEDNVRENPAVWYDPAANRHHLLFSGGHWRDDTYATGHALSGCGPLCPSTTTGGWRIVDSGDRGIVQVVRALGDADFAYGGPGGAVFVGDAGLEIVYAAAASSASGDKTRYLMRDSLKWKNQAPYVDTAGHRPLGF